MNKQISSQEVLSKHGKSHSQISWNMVNTSGMEFYPLMN